MFIPSKIYHSHSHPQSKKLLPDTFGILSWNIYKQNHSHKEFKHFLQQTIQMYPVDFFIFQEARFRPNTPCLIEPFSFDAAANLEYKENFYGVLTAGRSLSVKAKAYLSHAKEAYCGTYKSILLTTYHFQNGEILLIVNIHAINFRENNAYTEELERLIAYLSDYNGKLIIAGDFNTWNRHRLQKLFSVTKALKLKYVPLGYKENVKTVFGNPLDLIFYRGVELLLSEVLDDGGISDHRPLFAYFHHYG